MAAGRLGFLHKDGAYLTNHGVHDVELVCLLTWSAERGLGINMNKLFEYIL